MSGADDGRLIATVEPDDSGGLLVLLPDGEIRGASTSREASALIESWSARLTRKTNQNTIVYVQWIDGARPEGVPR